ncbi:metallophosphoesterase family protein [Lactiplantibacillus herbarum]|uniref:metallophosphoesterase family protein n=1 Tax=Lactiplantibacillus herbarum TaxID=1670446 RepID=UPI00064E83ED|nr:metallophosphoesterase family protein [Lactiplantibacillus herbarum]
MRKIAVISDVHGNVTALKAVLADAQEQHCTDYWFLGDLFLPGPGTSDLLALLDEVHVTAYIRGNWEEGLFEVIDGPITDTTAGSMYLTILGDNLLQQLSTAEIKRIRHLPTSQMMTVAGVKFQLSHNLLTKDYGGELMPAADQANFDELAGSEADIVLYGHTHHQLLRQSSAGQLIINPGTVGMPFPHWERFLTDLRAQYAIITLDDAGLPAVDFRKVAYDAESELALASQRQLPYLELYAEQLKTGAVYTHDDETLARVTNKLGYQDWFQTVLKRVN